MGVVGYEVKRRNKCSSKYVIVGGVCVCVWLMLSCYSCLALLGEILLLLLGHLLHTHFNQLINTRLFCSLVY